MGSHSKCESHESQKQGVTAKSLFWVTGHTRVTQISQNTVTGHSRVTPPTQNTVTSNTETVVTPKKPLKRLI